MSQYTIQIRTLVEDYHLNIFDFVYPFYTDSPKWKQEFENLFINHYYHHEIGFETVERFQQRLQSRLNMIMPYYSQLYLTQWNVVGKDMMLSKDLEEKTIRELLTDGTIIENIDSSSTESNDGESSNQGNTTESNESESSTQVNTTDENSQTSHSESQSTSTGQSTQNESRIEDGVSIVNLENGNKTATSQNETQATSTGESDDTSSYEGTSTSSSTSSSSQEGTSTTSSTSSIHNESTGSQLTSKEGTSQSKTTETLTFLSKGDVGIQTPAYAITEWRKVLININQMIINECEDLFMLIY